MHSFLPYLHRQIRSYIIEWVRAVLCTWIYMIPYQMSRHEEQCFIRFPNTEKRIENTTRSGIFFDEIRGVWKSDETLSRVFDISSQSKQNLRSKQRNKIVKIYANLSKPPSKLWFPLLTWSKPLCKTEQGHSVSDL